MWHGDFRNALNFECHQGGFLICTFFKLPNMQYSNPGLRTQAGMVVKEWTILNRISAERHSEELMGHFYKMSFGSKLFIVISNLALFLRIKTILNSHQDKI